MATAILFDGVDDQMVYTGPPQLTGALTILIVARILVVSDVTWLSLVEQESSGAVVRPSLGRRNTGEIYEANAAALVSGGAITDSDGWMIVACTKAAGTSTPNGHKLIIGGARTTTAMSGTLADDGAYPGGTLRIGGNDDFANIAVACAATWTSVLTTGQLDGINTAKTSQSILDLSPQWMVDASDGLVADQVGTADRTSVTGTSAAANDPTGWVYLGGAAVSAQLPPAQPRLIYLRKNR